MPPCTIPRVLALASAAAALLSGCTRRDTPAETGLRTQVLHVGNGAEPQEIDPHLTTGSLEAAIQSALFEPLLTRDPRTAKPVPGAARSWEMSADGQVYTFRLRPEARWSDGTPVTADDFVQSVRRALTPAVGAEYATDFYCVSGARDFHQGKTTDFSTVGVAAPDPHTVRFSLVGPAPHFLELLPGSAWLPIPVHVLKKHGALDRRGSPWTRPGNLVGNGPFVMKEWVQHQRIVVERSPTYWNSAGVRLHQIIFYPVEHADTEERMFRAGQLHVTRSVPSSKLLAYQRDNPAVLRAGPVARNYYYVFNVDRPPFTDVRVRRALALAIDRERLVTQVLRGGQSPARNFNPPDPDGYTAAQRLEEDLTEAQRLLAAAGFPGGAGLPRLELLLYNTERNRLVAEAVQEMWRHTLGVHVQMRFEEWKVYLDSMKSGHYQITMDSWNQPHPYQFYDLLTTGNSSSYNRWSDPGYDELFRQLLSKTAETGRQALYDRMEDLIAREMPVIPLYFDVAIHLVRTEVQGWYPNRLDFHPWPPVYLAPGGR
jgi:oligopeptide transport system substrate-binding protein